MGGSIYPQMLEPQPAPAGGFAPPTEEWDTISKTVVQFRDRACLDALTQITVPPTATVIALQRLMDVITQLRSQPQHPHQPLTPEALLPYISDEAYELLDALQPDALLSGPASQFAASNQPGWALVESLRPQLLWAVARSSFATMQLIEGLQVKARPPQGEWQSGILRLAVTLQLATAQSTAVVDLALGQAPQMFLDHTWQIQLEANDFSWPDWEIGLGTDSSFERSPQWVTQQLQEVTHRLTRTQPVLSTWLGGVVVDLLLPNQTWQTGTLQLQLGFDFMPHVVTPPYPSLHPIEAELLEELETSGPQEVVMDERTHSQPTIPITVVEMPFSTAIATTLIRLATPSTLDTFIQLAMQQEMVASIHACQAQIADQSGEEALFPLVQTGAKLVDLQPAIADTHFCLLQPELLLDELIPKLLWHVTRSSFPLMEWVGGVAATVCQPKTTWRSGILRLVMVLNLQTQVSPTQTEQWLIDLATGRFAADDGWPLQPDAIAQLHPSPTAPLLPIAQLQAQLQHDLQTAAPELACLCQGVAVEWLTPAHDWQSGHLTLQPKLEFMPNLF